MRWAIRIHLLEFVVDPVGGACRTDDAKDREIALLRHQLRVLQRRSPRPARLSRWEQLTLAIVVAKLGRSVADARSCLSDAVLLVRLKLPHFHGQRSATGHD